MKFLLGFLLFFALIPEVLGAQSDLLESVKKNPKEANSLCKEFRELNTKGISASSKETINKLAKEKNISSIEAEILSIYVIGLYCPDIN